MIDRGAAYKGLSSLEVVKNMSIRKQKMLAMADVCIALPGGPGTLEEISEAFSWARLGSNDNLCIFYNVNGYYDSLAAMFDEMTKKEFLSKNDIDKLLFSSSLEEIFKFINTYVPPKM